jgi:cytosine/creatinine deaminase
LPRLQAQEVARRLAAVGAIVIALPATNLYLQDRSQVTPRRRGLTLVKELFAAGVRVWLGSDNVRDSFYPYGDADPLEDALLLSLAAHVDEPAQLTQALCAGHREPAIGDVADLVLVRAASLADALARRPKERIVLRAGKMVDTETS